MRIIQLIFTLSSGGAEKFVVNLSNQLAKMGHEVILMQLRNDGDDAEINFNLPFLSPQVRYVNIGLTKGYKFTKAYKVMKEIKKMSPDIVHSHLNVLPYYYPLTLLPGKTRFIHTLHNVANKETRIKWQQNINRIVYKTRLITPVTISEECQKSFMELYGLSSPPCIDNGCPPISSTDKIENVRKEIGNLKYTPDTKVFIHIARFNEAKNQIMLIETFNRLIEDGIDAELLIIGAGFETDAAKDLREKACKRIHILGTRTNIGDYLLNSDYFILSSLWEGLPISLIEALSARMTTICTPAGGIPNVIKDGYNGFLSPDFSQEAFLETIHRALRTTLDANAIYKSYLDAFSMEKCASEYEKLYMS